MLKMSDQRKSDATHDFVSGVDGDLIGVDGSGQKGSSGED
jgi:hypothetical protein